jgi:broad specificity phosphatase PhoE
MELGEWCGKNSEEIQRFFPKEHEEWQRGNFGPDFRFPGGESIEEVAKRIWNCFDIIKKLWLNDKDEASSDLIIVAHGGTNMIILTEIMKAEIIVWGFRSLKQDNTCVNIIGFREKGGWRPETEILLINSTHHLDMDFSKTKSGA